MSSKDAEPMAGTAPPDGTWLFVEYAGAWGRQAVAESRLDEDVRAFLAGLDGVRVQLIRRYGGGQGAGVRIFLASLGFGVQTRVWTTVLDDVRDVLDLEVESLTDGAGLASYDEAVEGPLWFVCTNGRRDVCCAEIGRPIAAALAARWPEGTWETTHLGGHRFSGTLLALPSGICLGRLDPGSAVAACHEILAGRMPGEYTRGRAGCAGAVQFAELHLRAERGFKGLDEVGVSDVDGDAVTLHTPDGHVVVRIDTTKGEPRRQSCADLKTKPAPVYRVRSITDAPR